jgi:hypothetical protein
MNQNISKTKRFLADTIYMTSDVTFKNQNYSSTSTNRIIVGTGSPFGDEFILRAGVAILI